MYEEKNEVVTFDTSGNRKTIKVYVSVVAVLSGCALDELNYTNTMSKRTL